MCKKTMDFESNDWSRVDNRKTLCRKCMKEELKIWRKGNAKAKKRGR